MNPFNSFDGDMLFSFMELAIVVSIEDSEIRVRLVDSDIDITDSVDQDIMTMLGDEWQIAKETQVEDDSAAYGDYLYEQEKDKRLSEI